ncbi:hypothetical protein GCM10011386_29050 [Parapedobacter defluvii]|uniref:Uncharacterized protein n=1 Tax=Parapedobacter defluvii TaxID=2045106 RepID=A0ABQ1M5L7_9SPHI|nr:hypothetical protein [Parapedobacter defluvii]GGC35113.1 hypothetical protein GCM10011386_29050 [Parapedobacter defluvii]
MSEEVIKELILDGNHIHDIPWFYDEVNRIFMRGADFTLGPRLAVTIAFYWTKLEQPETASV